MSEHTVSVKPDWLRKGVFFENDILIITYVSGNLKAISGAEYKVM
jgi:hypothetical protein